MSHCHTDNSGWQAPTLCNMSYLSDFSCNLWVTTLVVIWNESLWTLQTRTNRINMQATVIFIKPSWNFPSLASAWWARYEACFSPKSILTSEITHFSSSWGNKRQDFSLYWEAATVTFSVHVIATWSLSQPHTHCLKHFDSPANFI